MVKRKKRLERGVFSLEKQIRLHESKRQEAVETGKEELADYYTREIASKLETKKEKEEFLKREKK